MRRRREWIQFIVHIDFGEYAFSPEFHAGVRQLRKIEAWCRDHHSHYAMFDEWGFPRFPSGNIPVTFPADAPEKAMEYRVFINGLGLGRSLISYRLVDLPEPRLTPTEQLAYF
ncbi:MAG: hypothetical protein FJX65_15840 [Alphaproteobacteria bacterium]|nr:hypothetical protein [Alphaproteobacteria bacterium]